MALVKGILFIDGENLAFRYQEMLKAGRKPKDGITHIPDIFVWHNNIANLWKIDFYRVLFYSSVVGDDVKIKEIKKNISQQIFHEEMEISRNYFGKLQIAPWIFKKQSQSHKSRLVDISITIDSMRFSYTNAADVLCFISGDGDFLNLYSELMRNGKKVSVAALSTGLSESVRSSVDYFINLDDILFTAS
ncbi:MAG: NYN domain-containing protein [Gammaproteobacteria bacterium]